MIITTQLEWQSIIIFVVPYDSNIFPFNLFSNRRANKQSHGSRGTTKRYINNTKNSGIWRSPYHK